VEQLDDPVRGRELYRSQIALVKSLDSTREVTCALHPGYADRGNEIPSSMMHLSRVVSYNYRTDSFAAWHERYPELVFLAAETKIYGTRPHEDHQVIDFSDNSWNDMDDYVAGQFIWSGIDYLGESAGWPDRGWRHGLLYTNGFIKPYAWYIASRYQDDPLVKLTVKDSLYADSLNRSGNWQRSWMGPPLVDHWSFREDSLQKEVVVFTNCERVDLQLNGKVVSSLERSNFRDGVIKSRLDYIPGELVALAYFKDEEGKQQVVSDTLSTSRQPYTLAMQSDRKQIRSNSRDVVHITTRVTDSTGVTHPHGRQTVSYSLDGPGKIRVIDNGDLADHHPQGSSRELRNGKQLLILQAGSEPGDLIIRASAEGLKSSSVKIKSKNKP
jgi:beta-galactosidase